MISNPDGLSDVYNAGNSINSNGFNAFSIAKFSEALSTDIFNLKSTDISLTSLDYNGGFTKTYMPIGGSVLIDAGNPMDVIGAQNRALFSFRDIGASEYCNVVYGVDTVVACNSYTWIDGVTYTNDNDVATYVYPKGAYSGCDSIVSLFLTIIDLGIEVLEEFDVLRVSSSIGTYSWLDCSNGLKPLSIDTDTIAIGLTNSYAVEVSTAECKDTSECVDVILVGNIDEKENLMSFYPNPVQESLIISFKENASVFRIRVLDEQGVVFREIARGSDYLDKMTLDVTEMLNGVYFLEVITEDVKQTSSFFKY